MYGAGPSGLGRGALAEGLPGKARSAQKRETRELQQRAPCRTLAGKFREGAVGVHTLAGLRSDHDGRKGVASRTKASGCRCAQHRHRHQHEQRRRQRAEHHSPPPRWPALDSKSGAFFRIAMSVDLFSNLTAKDLVRPLRGPCGGGIAFFRRRFRLTLHSCPALARRSAWCGCSPTRFCGVPAPRLGQCASASGMRDAFFPPDDPSTRVRDCGAQQQRLHWLAGCVGSCEHRALA